MKQLTPKEFSQYLHKSFTFKTEVQVIDGFLQSKIENLAVNGKLYIRYYYSRYDGLVRVYSTRCGMEFEFDFFAIAHGYGYEKSYDFAIDSNFSIFKSSGFELVDDEGVKLPKHDVIDHILKELDKRAWRSDIRYSLPILPQDL